MSDIVDTANKAFDYFLKGQIEIASKQAAPNDIDECFDCGEPIGDARKRALPSAIRCVCCQNKYETRTRRW